MKLFAPYLGFDIIRERWRVTESTHLGHGRRLSLLCSERLLSCMCSSGLSPFDYNSTQQTSTAEAVSFTFRRWHD